MVGVSQREGDGVKKGKGSRERDVGRRWGVKSGEEEK